MMRAVLVLTMAPLAAAQAIGVDDPLCASYSGTYEPLTIRDIQSSMQNTSIFSSVQQQQRRKLTLL